MGTIASATFLLLPVGEIGEARRSTPPRPLRDAAHWDQPQHG